MAFWIFAILLGCVAGALTPMAWFALFRGGEWIYSKLTPSSGEAGALNHAVLLPAAVAALVFALQYLFRAFRSADGFTYFISDLHFQDGRRKWRYSFVHGLSSFLLLLGGGVAGLEGLGFEWLSVLGSKFGTWGKLSANQVRTLAACGATAAVAAVLGQPMAAVLFIVELLYGWGSLSFAVGAYAVTAFVAASVSQSLTSPAGLFGSLFGTDAGLSMALRAEPIEFSGALTVFLAVALVASVASLFAGFSLWLHKKTDAELHALFETRRASDISPGALLVRVALWAALTAFVMHSFPATLGSGVQLLHDALSQGYLLKVAVLALLLRLLMGVLTYSVIGSMGLVLPTLVLGGMLGATLSLALASWVLIPKATVALLAMGAFFSASFGTPVAATALVFGYASGLTSDSAILLFTSLAANFAAHGLTSFLAKDRLATLGLYRHGIRFQNGMCFNTLSAIQVRDAMVTYVSPIPNAASLGEAYKILMESKHTKLPVTDAGGKLLGMLSLSDFYGLEAWKRLGEESQVHSLLGVEDMVKPAGASVRPETNLESALARMHDEELIPVVDGENEAYTGILLKSDLVNLYNKEVVKKAFRR